MADEPKTGNSPKSKKCCDCGCLQTCSNFVNTSLERFFYWLGAKIGRNPWITIIICFVVSGLWIIGLLNFTEENRGEKLWAADDSIAIKHGDWVSANFPSQSRISSILVVASNVLIPAVLTQLLEIDKKVKLIKNGTENSWEKLCFRLGPNCFDSSLLELWSFNETTIRALSQSDILDKINQPNLRSPITGRLFVKDEVLGEMKKGSSGKITGAGAMKASYGIKAVEEVSSSGSASFPKNEDWEKEFGKILDNLPSTAPGTYYYFSRYTFSDAAGNSIQGDVTLLSAGYMLIIVYVVIMLGQFTRLRLKAWLGVAGVICVGLSIGVSFGMSSAFGVFYGPVHSVLPFLLLGIGVDDMFVIVQAWNNLTPEEHKTKEVHERIALTLQHAGCSITITSLTDFLAFLIGASTVLPGLQSFCIYAGLGILIDFILQITLFSAFLTLDGRREDRKRDGCCCCCIVLPVDYTESQCGSRELMKVFFESYYCKAILSLPGKVIVMIITGVLFGLSLYGTLMLKQDFDAIWFLPTKSMAYKYTIENDKFFPSSGERAALYAGKINYFEDQLKLHKLREVTIADSGVVDSSVKSWFDDYVDWAKVSKPAANFNAEKSKILNETLFYTWLNEYLGGPGRTYASDVKMYNTSNGKRISATRITYNHKAMDSSQDEVKAMESLRDRVKEIYPDDMIVFTYGAQYPGWETNKIILLELYRNIALALLAVFIVTIVVIANLWTALMVFTCVAFTLVDLCGFMYFWGLTIDTITTIQLVLAVGLAVDYSSHIGHMFMITPGTHEDRARITMRDMGPAVLNGGFSTFLAFVLLAASDSYIFGVFFKIFFLVVLFGMWHGMAYLPVLLSSIGPAPYLSAQVSDRHNKSGRASPVHPKSENVELPEKNTRGQSAGVQQSQPVQNDGFYIPPPDYDGREVDDTLKSSSPVNKGYSGSSSSLKI
ncbi:patched domain-containing protein 3 [Nematostella vectensis]|uniref:patched domain-containing protein 3 n=1 Tax=Nematostella vectensis TaxID=45351 RepID=UPI00207742EA|nr:patched domain-containing protein 3 [Nematostella vectensis]